MGAEDINYEKRYDGVWGRLDSMLTASYFHVENIQAEGDNWIS